MHDPWDVSVTRRSDQYVSCMKINGVPLLPPVLSRECRKEMQYYKALALEVEKRISLLRSFVDSKDAVKADITDIKEPENYSENEKQINSTNFNNADVDPDFIPDDESIRSYNTGIDSNNHSPVLSSPKLVIGIIDDFKGKLLTEQDKNNIDTPERDLNCSPDKIIKKSETVIKFDNKDLEKENISPTKRQCHNNKKVSPPSTPVAFRKRKDSLCKNTGPSSLSSSKSVDDIHAELASPPKLVRQRSYTILKPGPALLAHLEVQSLTSGVEISSISMSESCSNLSWLAKKRKSWDLESAKVKWSSMAIELNNKKTQLLTKNTTRPNEPSQTPKAIRVRSATNEKTKRTNSSVRAPPTPNSVINNVAPKSVQKACITARPRSPDKNDISINSPKMSTSSILSHEVVDVDLPKSNSIKENITPILSSPTQSAKASTRHEDPSSSVRDLYDKIRNQQNLQMASLLEKQKREKLLLQQLFEEQNSLFYKQLKTICPKSPVEVKKAWTEKTVRDDGPVSLSQLINGPKPSDTNTTVILSTTLNDTQNCIEKTDEVLKKGRNVRQSSATKPKQKHDHSSSDLQPRPKSLSSSIPRHMEKTSPSGSHAIRNSCQSPRRHLTSDSSSRSEVEPILTDRTDHTLADLNFTLTSEENVEFYPEVLARECTFTMEDRSNQSNLANSSSGRRGKTSESPYLSLGLTQTSKIHTVKHSPRNNSTSEKKTVRKLFADKPSTIEERIAASRIVAYARGYLTRRLMRTERVQTTVQTIRDALVCALQLHQDREGICGADIDLHRRLIQQITAACYNLHDTFIVSSPQERCALIAQDRERQRALEEKQLNSAHSASRSSATPTRRHSRRKSRMSWWKSKCEASDECSPLSSHRRDAMSQSHSGVLGARPPRVVTPAMARSSHEMYTSEEKLRPTPSKFNGIATPICSRRPWR